MTENIDKLERGALRALPEDSTEYSVLMARQCVSDLAALAREAEKKRIRDYGGHIHPLGHFCGSNCPMNPENAAARAREGETRAGSRGNATQDAIDHLARRVAELEQQATQDGATILLREAERDEAEGKYVAEIVRHTRTEGRVAELEAALRDTLQEIDELGTEYTALRKKHEPPYIVYIPWSRPGVLRVLGTTTGPEPPEEKMRRYMEGDPKRAGDGGGA